MEVWKFYHFITAFLWHGPLLIAFLNKYVCLSAIWWNCCCKSFLTVFCRVLLRHFWNSFQFNLVYWRWYHSIILQVQTYCILEIVLLWFNWVKKCLAVFLSSGGGITHRTLVQSVYLLNHLVCLLIKNCIAGNHWVVK